MGTSFRDQFCSVFGFIEAALKCNTAGPSLQTAANMEQHLHERVRCFQFAYWLSGSDLFQVFGALRSAELSGGASWATLAPFLADRASAKKDEGIIETIESGSDE